MTSRNEAMLENWKATAATLFNPYVNLNSLSSSHSRQQSVKTRVVTPTRHSRAPPESVVANSNSKSKTPDEPRRVLSKQLPSPDAAEDVTIYVQQMIHSQFCGRSGTPSDMRYEQQQQQNKARRTKSTPTNNRLASQLTLSSDPHPSRVSDYQLDHFFDRADEQMSRMALLMPGRESTFSDYVSPSRQSQSRRSNGERFTLADMCDVASNVGDKMSQSKEKVGLEAIRGFRLPSARLTYEPYEHHPIDGSIVLGHQTPSDPIRLRDVLTNDNYSNEQMIEIVDDELQDEKASKFNRNATKSERTSPTKTFEFKDWRGKISQPTLPDVRIRMRRDHSATVISPQRPCTAASNLSKSRPDSSAIHLDSNRKEANNSPRNAFRSSIVQSPLTKQRRRVQPLNVRIEENLNKSDDLYQKFVDETKKEQSVTSSQEHIIDPPGLSLTSETIDETRRENDANLRPTPDELKSESPSGLSNKENSPPNKPFTPKQRNYKLIRNSSKQIFRIVPSERDSAENDVAPEHAFHRLSLNQLELLEQYDPVISAKIGVPFLPLQILARPEQSQTHLPRSIEQIEKDYPKRNGQPIFEGRKLRRTNSFIDISQTLQLTKSKRLPVQRQTTFERVETDSNIEQTMQIKPIENPHRLALVLYSSPDQHSFLKHMNSTRTSSKIHRSHSEENSTLVQEKDAPMTNALQPEQDLSVVNIRTRQEVDQARRREKSFPRRPLFPTSIVTNANLNSPRLHPPKAQPGRPIPSVFLTEDPDHSNQMSSIYRQARSDVDIPKAFKGFVVQNYRKKLSAEERFQREEQQKAAIRIQRAYRGHLKRRRTIERSRPSTGQWSEREKEHRRVLSAKRASNVDQQLQQQSRIRRENLEYEGMVEQTGPSLYIYAAFNQIDDRYSKETLNRAATCIQRWWRGYAIRSKWRSFKEQVSAFGLTWRDFSSRYRSVIQRIEEMREAPHQQFIFEVEQAKQFLHYEKKLTTIFAALSFNDKLDANELKQFFDASDLSATDGEIQQALQIVLQHYPETKLDSLRKEIVFDVVYYIYPPKGTGLPTSRKSTWVRPIIDGEDETAIQGTPFLEPIDPNVVYRFLGQE